jgi:hypothetical protein
VFKAAYYEAASKVLPPEKIELSDGFTLKFMNEPRERQQREFHDAGLFVLQ